MSTIILIRSMIQKNVKLIILSMYNYKQSEVSAAYACLYGANRARELKGMTYIPSEPLCLTFYDFLLLYCASYLGH